MAIKQPTLWERLLAFILQPFAPKPNPARVFKARLTGPVARRVQFAYDSGFWDDVELLFGTSGDEQDVYLVYVDPGHDVAWFTEEAGALDLQVLSVEEVG